jgi:hypothetical protein
MLLEILVSDPDMFLPLEEEGHGAPLGFGQGSRPHLNEQNAIRQVRHVAACARAMKERRQGKVRKTGPAAPIAKD